MALNFNVLAQVPSIAERFMAGEQAAREEQQRNMLLQQRQMEFQQAQQDRQLAAQERQRKAAQLEADRTRRQTFLTQLRDQMAKGGHRLNRESLSSMLDFGIESGEDSLVQLATRGLKDLDDEEAWQSAFGGGARPPAAAAAPAPAMPAAAPAMPAAAPAMEAPPEPAIDESGVNRAAWMAKAGLEEDIVPAPAPAPVANVLAAAPEAAAPVNVLAAAPAAPAVDAERQRLNALLNNRNKAIRDEARERLKALNAATPRPIVVGGRLLSPTGQVIYEPPPGSMTPAERFVPVGPNVFNRETGQFLPGPAREPALRQTPEARVKPAAPIRVRPGEVVISPETGQPIFTAPPAPARAAAERGAAPAGGTPAQLAKAEAQQAAQTKLSQDLQTQLGYYEELAKMGAMSSPGRPVVANVLAYARSSGLGQEAERAAGTKAQTLRDNIANARQRILMHVKNATGATAGQMNSNIELQTWLRSLTDPQQSIETVRETLKQMDAVIGSVRNQVAQEGTRRAPAAAPAPAPAPAPAAANRREIAPGVFVTERP